MSRGRVTFTVTGSVEPTKLTHVTADRSAVVPSTVTVNIGGGEEREREEEREWGRCG